MAYTQPLVSPEWVSQRLGSDEIRLVEVDEDTTLYDSEGVRRAHGCEGHHQ
jgi:3-mercaptopyruvate sulfurtransferase SseA